MEWRSRDHHHRCCGQRVHRGAEGLGQDYLDQMTPRSPGRWAARPTSATRPVPGHRRGRLHILTEPVVDGGQVLPESRWRCGDGRRADRLSSRLLAVAWYRPRGRARRRSRSPADSGPPRPAAGSLPRGGPPTLMPTIGAPAGRGRGAGSLLPRTLSWKGARVRVLGIDPGLPVRVRRGDGGGGRVVGCVAVATSFAPRRAAGRATLALIVTPWRSDSGTGPTCRDRAGVHQTRPNLMGTAQRAASWPACGSRRLPVAFPPQRGKAASPARGWLARNRSRPWSPGSRWPSRPPADAADALALAICHCGGPMLNRMARPGPLGRARAHPPGPPRRGGHNGPRTPCPPGPTGRAHRIRSRPARRFVISSVQARCCRSFSTSGHRGGRGRARGARHPSTLAGCAAAAEQAGHATGRAETIAHPLRFAADRSGRCSGSPDRPDRAAAGTGGLAVHDRDTLRRAIVERELKTLTRVPGSAKVAERSAGAAGQVTARRRGHSPRRQRHHGGQRRARRRDAWWKRRGARLHREAGRVGGRRTLARPPTPTPTPACCCVPLSAVGRSRESR